MTRTWCKIRVSRTNTPKSACNRAKCSAAAPKCTTIQQWITDLNTKTVVQTQYRSFDTLQYVPLSCTWRATRRRTRRNRCAATPYEEEWAVRGGVALRMMGARRPDCGMGLLWYWCQCFNYNDNDVFDYHMYPLVNGLLRCVSFVALVGGIALQ